MIAVESVQSYLLVCEWYLEVIDEIKFSRLFLPQMLVIQSLRIFTSPEQRQMIMHRILTL